MQRPWRLPDKLRRKYETVEALGLTEKLRDVGWAGLSAKEAGRIGGTMRGKTDNQAGKRMYTGFAEVYDTLMNDVHYGAWADMYARMMTAYGIPRNAKVCECACGTGSLTLPLQQLGYEMMGIDLSQEMLWQAAQKARKAGFGIPFIRQDMRQLRLHRPVDAVLATCDGVNYLLQDVDAAAFFQSAWDAIKPGGGLFFDVSTPYKLEHLLGSQFMGEDRRDVTYMWQNRYFPERQQVEMHLAIFVKEPDGRYRRIDEEQVQRAYQAEKLVALLQSIGFVDVRVFGTNALTHPAPEEHRWHIAARKPE